MKANELNCKDLMIGDWVKVKYPQKQVKVKETKQSCIYTEGNGYEYSEIEPIPLTPEILEKNGFTKCNVDNNGAVQYEFGFDDIGIDVWIAQPCLLGSWRRWEGLEKTYSMINELPIQYVHQLQHALRLCGITREIIL